MMGRHWVSARGVGGMLGVARGMQLLRGEVELAMAQLGGAWVGEIGAGILWAAHAGNEAGRN